MTSISAFSSAAYTSPRDRLQSQLTSSISAGKIDAADETALSSALDSIDSALSGGRSADRAAGGKPPSPDELQAKIGDLVQEQVDAGKLTEEQASELTALFEEAFAGGPGGAGGPPPGGPPPGGAGSASGSGGGETDALANLIKQLQDAVKSITDYTASGQGSQSDQSGKVVDLLA